MCGLGFQVWGPPVVGHVLFVLSSMVVLKPNRKYQVIDFDKVLGCGFRVTHR